MSADILMGWLYDRERRNAELERQLAEATAHRRHHHLTQRPYGLSPDGVLPLLQWVDTVLAAEGVGLDVRDRVAYQVVHGQAPPEPEEPEWDPD